MRHFKCPIRLSRSLHRGESEIDGLHFDFNASGVVAEGAVEDFLDLDFGFGWWGLLRLLLSHGEFVAI